MIQVKGNNSKLINRAKKQTAYETTYNEISEEKKHLNYSELT